MLMLLFQKELMPHGRKLWANRLWAKPLKSFLKVRALHPILLIAMEQPVQTIICKP